MSLFLLLSFVTLASTQVSPNAESTTSLPINHATEWTSGTRISAHVLTAVPWIDSETYAILDGYTYRTITLQGGQTSEVTFTRYLNATGKQDISAFPQSTGRCTGEGREAVTNDAFTSLATYRSTLTLQEGTSTTFVPFNFGTGPITSTVLQGPTVAELLKTTPFVEPAFPYDGRSPYQQFLPLDDGSCFSDCGGCAFYYPSISVRYWPNSAANTACVTESPGQKIKYRAIGTAPNNPANFTTGSTAVENGFTYTSPSIYIEFPTFFAWDLCGQLGPSTNFMTRSYDPASISSVVLDSTFGTSYFPFDFNSAECPPQSVADNQYWMAVGTDGRQYNPIISGLQDLTDINPLFKSCVPGPFQGHDPPTVLTPAANLLPNPTPPAPKTRVPASPASTTTNQPAETAFAPTAQPAFKAPPDTPTSSKLDPIPTSTLPAKDPETHNDPTIQDPPASKAESQSPNVPQNASPDPSPDTDPAGNRPSQNPASPSPVVQDPTNEVDASKVAPEKETNAPENTNTQQTQDKPDPVDSNSASVNQASNDPTQESKPAEQDAEDPVQPSPIHIDPASEQSLSILGTTVQVQPSSNLVLGDHTLKPGDSITISSTPVIFSPPEATQHPGVIAVSIEKPESFETTILPPISIGNSIITPDADSSFRINDKTFSPGAIVTVSGNTLTLPKPSATLISHEPSIFAVPNVITANSNSDFVIDGQTLKAGATTSVNGVAVTAPTISSAPLLFTHGGTTYTASSSNFVIGDQTYKAGQVATIEGTAITLPSQNSAQPLLWTLPGSAITPDASSNYVINSKTYSAGATATISGTLVTLPSAAKETDVLTFGGQTYTASASHFVIGGQTLTPGGEITVQGSTISLVASSSSADVGDAIASGLGGGVPQATGTDSNDPIATGAAGRPITSSMLVVGSVVGTILWML